MSSYVYSEAKCAHPKVSLVTDWVYDDAGITQQIRMKIRVKLRLYIGVKDGGSSSELDVL